jgi:hypothetical protein
MWQQKDACTVGADEAAWRCLVRNKSCTVPETNCVPVTTCSLFNPNQEMGGACSAHGSYKKFVKNCSPKAGREGTTWQAWAQMGG